MRVINMPRASGKTITLVNMMRQDSTYGLIVLNQKEKTRIVKMYNLSECEAVRVIPIGASVNMLEGISRLLIDDADIVLRNMFGKNVEVMTATR